MPDDATSDPAFELTALRAQMVATIMTYIGAQREHEAEELADYAYHELLDLHGAIHSLINADLQHMTVAQLRSQLCEVRDKAMKTAIDFMTESLRLAVSKRSDGNAPDDG